MEEELGLEDIWTKYASPRYGAKIGITNDPSVCLPDPCCGQYADDHVSDNISDKPNDEGRIDYIFIQKPCEDHDMSVDISRPRRMPFKRDPSSDEYNKIQYLSDHVGMEIVIFISSK